MNKGETEDAIENQLKHLKSATIGAQTVMAKRLKTLLHFLSHECHARGSQGATTSLPPTGHSRHAERRPEGGGSALQVGGHPSLSGPVESVNVR